MSGRRVRWVALMSSLLLIGCVPVREEGGRILAVEPTNRRLAGEPADGSRVQAVEERSTSDAEEESADDLQLRAVVVYGADGSPHLRVSVHDEHGPVVEPGVLRVYDEEETLLHDTPVGIANTEGDDGVAWRQVELPESVGLPRWSGAGQLIDFWSSRPWTRTPPLEIEIALADDRSGRSLLRIEPPPKPRQGVVTPALEAEMIDLESGELGAMLAQIFRQIGMPTARQPARVGLIGFQLALPADTGRIPMKVVSMNDAPSCSLSVHVCALDHVDVQFTRYAGGGGTSWAMRFWRGEGRISLSHRLDAIRPDR